jgi:uncharacterized protein
MLDLSAIQIVDHHCHNLLTPGELSEADYVACFTEAYDPDVLADQTRQTLSFHRGLREVAELLGCEAELAAILAAREQLGFEAWAERCLAASGIETLLLDDGFQPERIQPLEWHSRFGQIRRIVRVEYLAEQLIPQVPRWTMFQEAFRAVLADLPPEVVGFKSVVAYRGGLQIERPDPSDAASAFRALHRQAAGGQRVRLASPALNNWVVLATLDAAARSGRPLQLHTGFGDPDLDLRLANPLHLRPLLESAAYRDVSFVLLHAAYPFTREAGYLANVYPNVFVDLGLAIPFLSVAGMRAVVRASLELTPLNRLLFSTDAHLIPELYYLGARWGRRALGTELERAVSDGDLTGAEAEAAGEAVLRGNAVRLYGLHGSS